MKTLRLQFKLCMVLSFLCIQLRSQLYSQSNDSYPSDNPLIVTYNFDTKLISGTNNLENLKAGDYYQIKIINLNTYLYKVSLSKSDSINATSLFVPTFGSFSLDALSTLINTLLPTGGVTGIPEVVKFKAVETKQLTTENFDYLPAHNTGNLEKIKNEHGADSLLRANDSILKINFKKLSNIKSKIDDTLFKYNKLIIISQQEFNTSSCDLENESFCLSGLYSDFVGFRDSLSAINEKIDKLYKMFKMNSIKFAKTIEDNPILKKGATQIDGSYQEFFVSIQKSKEAISADNSLKYITLLQAAFNNQGKVYLSGPIQFSKEITNLDISISPRKEDFNLQSYSTSLRFPLYPKNIWGVSSGLYLSGLHNDAYSLITSVNIDGDTTYNFVNENSPKYESGIIAQINYGWRLGKSSTYFDFGFGPAVSVSDKIRPRMTGNIGLAFGERRIFLLNGGINAGFTDKLSKAYDVNTKYSAKPENYMISRANFGWNISLTYLFMKK